MAKKPCFDCGNEVNTWNSADGAYFKIKDLKNALQLMNIQDKIMDGSDDEVLCYKCGSRVYCRHAVKVWKYHESALLPEEFEKFLQSGEDWIPIARAELDATQEKPMETSTSPLGTQNTTQTKITTIQTDERITNANELDRLAQLRHDEFKRQWRKGYTVQFKNDKIAILMRSQGSQVQFIVAFDQVTREGFRLMAIDEGKSIDGGAGFSGGISSYYYFQKMDYVR